MDESVNRKYWNKFVEIPRRISDPVKIDIILEKRLKAFLEAKTQKLN